MLVATRTRQAHAMELCCRRTKPSMKFWVQAGALTRHNCFKHFCWRAQLSLAAHHSRLLQGQSDVSGTECNAEDNWQTKPLLRHPHAVPLGTEGASQA